MPLPWIPCNFEISNNLSIRNEYAVLSKIGRSALNCIEVDPTTDSLTAFDRLISLFCVVAENTPAEIASIGVDGEESDQLSQTIQVLTGLKEYPQASLFPEEVLDFRIQLYADAARKIHGRLPADGNPIVEIL